MTNPLGMLRVSAAWEPLDANAAFLTMAEVEAVEHLRGGNLVDLYAEEQRDQVQRNHEALAQGRFAIYEALLAGRRGTRRNVVVSMNPLMFGQEFQGAVALFAPAGDFPQEFAAHTTQAITTAEYTTSRFKRVLDASPDVLFVISAYGVVLDYRAPNPALLVVPPEMFLQHNVAEFVPPPLLAQATDLFQKAFASDQSQTAEFTVELGLGLTVLNVTATRLDGQRLLAVVRDISPMRQAQQRLQQLDRERAHLARLAALGEMLAGISHEINQPLHAIAGFVGASLNKLEGTHHAGLEQVEEWLRKISSQTSRASEIVKRVRQFSSQAPHHSTLRVSELLSETAELIGGEVARRKIKFELRNLAAHATVVIDRIELQQVLINFIVNACEAMDQLTTGPRTITLTAKIEDGVLRCEVADQGNGLPAGPTEKMFAPFFTTKPHGLGLGLAISRTIIESMGGHVWAHPNQPCGAVFGFDIPRSPSGALST